MALTITPKTIQGDTTDHMAVINGNGAWEVTWIPGHSYDRELAISAIAIADIVARHRTTLSPDHPFWPHLSSWAADLGMTAEDAMTRSQVPREP